MPKSARHHYIPQFMIRGFRSPENNYYVFDKQRNAIKRYNSSESIFFEWHRNTVTEDGIEYSIVEDVYSRLDSFCSPAVAKMRTAPFDDLLNVDNLSGITAFIINIFWRVPKTDKIWDDFYENAKLTIVDPSGKPVTDPAFLSAYRASNILKLGHRSLMISDTLRHIQTLADVPIHHKIMTSPPGSRGAYLLGDYPIVYAREPLTLGDVVREEFFVPISAYRVYFTAKEVNVNLSQGKISAINSLIIDQAVRYVCSPDKEYLEVCVKHYELMKSIGALPSIRRLLFAGVDDITEALMEMLKQQTAR